MKNTLLIALALLFFACGKDENNTPTDTGFDRKAMLENIADNVIIPAYAELTVEIETLNNAILAYSSSPTEAGINSIKSAYLDSYKKWQHCSSFEFGPAEESMLRNNLNIYPTDTAKISSNIGLGSYDLQSVNNYAAKGFPALDFLLYGSANPHAYFTNATLGAKRLKYLQDLMSEMRSKILAANNAWKGSYRATFVNNTGTETGSSVSLLVNQLNQNLDNIKNAKVGIPLGKKTFGETRPGDSEALYSGISTELLTESIKSLEEVYTGKSGLGFDDYLEKLAAKSYTGASLNSSIKTQFTLIYSALSLINTPISDAVINDKTDTDKAWSELVTLLIYTKTDMPSALSVTITYSDNDGD
jgi:uncharacterized protein